MKIYHPPSIGLLREVRLVIDFENTLRNEATLLNSWFLNSDGRVSGQGNYCLNEIDRCLAIRADETVLVGSPQNINLHLRRVGQPTIQELTDNPSADRSYGDDYEEDDE